MMLDVTGIVMNTNADPTDCIKKLNFFKLRFYAYGCVLYTK